MDTEKLSRYGALIPLLTGLLWLGLASAAQGWLAFVIGILPGALIFGAGLASGFWPGDPRPLQVGAMASGLGTGLGLVSWLWVGWLAVPFLIVLSAASFIAFGAMSLGAEVPIDDIPMDQRSLPLAAWVAFDEALLGFIVPLGLRRRSYHLLKEGAEAVEFFEEHGWNEKPADYHQTPPPLEEVSRRRTRVAGIDFDHVWCESGYEPHPNEPGRERWLTYDACKTAHAWLIQHESPERPWLVCIHGLLMGQPRADFTAFRAKRLHEKLGLNLLFPVLPFHGPSGIGRISGNGFLSEQVLDTVHAFAQVSWDLRRWISWIRSQGGTRVGVHGLSLGGYTTALISSLEEDLACSIPGIPAVDFAGLAWRHAPDYELKRFEREGLDRAAFESVMRPVAPLALTPKVDKDRRYIFAGTADRLVPPDQVRALWEHWERPPIQWYPGAHAGFLLNPDVHRFIDSALRESELVT